MSNRGRGRGGGVKPNDRSSSTSSATSSRSPSLTRPTTPATIQDNDRIIKQLTKDLNPGSSASVNIGATTRPAAKFAVNIAAAKKAKDTTDSNTTGPSLNSSNVTSSFNKTDTLNGKGSQTSHSGDARHRGRNSYENYVQTEGIFKGNAQIPIKSTTSTDSRIPSGQRESSGSSTRTHNIKKLGQTKTVVIGDVDGLKYEIDEEYEPRQIPIAERKSLFNVKKEVDAIPKVKEPISTNSDHINSFIQLFSQQKLESLTKSLVKDEPIEPTSLPTTAQETNNDTSQLILMQFPDVLPCTRSSTSSTTTTKPELASLTDLPDGFLGKLQIYKSGKCRLKLNDDTYLDVDVGQPTSFLQNVMVTEMASSTTDQSTNNDMNKLVCLGDIKHKLIVSLDVDHILHDTRQ